MRLQMSAKKISSGQKRKRRSEILKICTSKKIGENHDAFNLTIDTEFYKVLDFWLNNN